ncbi:DUF927 domain-containing protein [Glaciimonas immobilis]|uniref:DUF927 domain-containing protein n=1 Tax=Glaciimonas immobilis TaxID=728004 RepID=UPI00143AA879|nr:DUF927 domain-containing protein [Glaciimonas immobilis]
MFQPVKVLRNYSVYDSHSLKQSWRATGNALEGTCALHKDAALILQSCQALTFLVMPIDRLSSFRLLFV